MAWYQSSTNRINCPPLPPTWQSEIITGRDNVNEVLVKSLIADVDKLNRPCFVILDGYKGANITGCLKDMQLMLKAAGLAVLPYNVNDVFHTKSKLDDILNYFEKLEDPSFGRVFPGVLEDLIDPEKVREVIALWEDLRRAQGARQVVICHGVGAGLQIWRHLFDRIVYLDITREEIIARADRNQLLPVGEDVASGFPWKRIYYTEYPVLNRHKKELLKHVDWYVDSCCEDDPKLIPAGIYHAIITELSGRPLAFKVFYMPGTFGGREFSKRFNVEGLPNTSWNYKLSVGDNHLIVDIGQNRAIEMPLYNIIWEQPLRVLGSYSNTTYPDHFPIAIYMQDGYFEPTENVDFKRTHMPHHLHPDTAYCRQQFGEPIGRYETYYIVRADKGARTMHGFLEHANIDEYIQQVKQSAVTKREFDWRRYIHEHPSETGELHQLPPGTVHGTGGRQVILEIDTNPSRESTEYSFYLYDYCRPTFNYEKNDFSGRPAKLQIEHSLAVLRRNRREAFMAQNCRPSPVCIRQGEDWREVSFPMYYNMPYQINRLEFSGQIEDDTADMFHCLALTLGSSVRVSSKKTPSNNFILEDCDVIVVPACFGPYICENLGEGSCEIIKTLLIVEPRDHIDKQQEERDWGEK
jgi:hypothetical protein